LTRPRDVLKARVMDFRLERFVRAQEGIYDDAVRELRAGRKVRHWMWFVFPQIAGLGRSPMAQEYAVSGLPEARAYLEHPVLGPRLLDCANLLTALDGVSAVEIFGPVDAQKLHSSMTLFARADPEQRVFQDVLDLYFDGREDEGTTSRL
jgi:uncharacterized protein (DUF1810 family)